MSLIGFDVKEETFRALAQRAAERGYQSVNGFVRSLAEAAVGVVDFNPLSAERQPLISSQESTILVSLQASPKTIAQIAEETGKWYTNLSTVAKKLVAKAWIEAVEEKHTGGRPATVYALTEAGRLRLDQEAQRRARLKAKADELAEAQRRESAKADAPNWKPRERMRAQDTTTPMGAWVQAALDALYAKTPEATDEQITAVLEPVLEDVKAQVEGGQMTTWEAETELLKKEGWFYT